MTSSLMTSYYENIVKHTTKHKTPESNWALFKKVASILRDEIEKGQTDNPTDTLLTDDSNIPHQLVEMLSLLLEDKDPADGDGYVSRSVLTLSGYVMYNYKKRPRKVRKLRSTSSVAPAQNQLRRRETAVVQYVSLKLYATVRSKTLIQYLHGLGLTLPYNRILEQLSSMSNRVLKLYNDEGCVIPSNLQIGLPTIYAKDNLDKDSSANSAIKHYHALV